MKLKMIRTGKKGLIAVGKMMMMVRARRSGRHVFSGARKNTEIAVMTGSSFQSETTQAIIDETELFVRIEETTPTLT